MLKPLFLAALAALATGAFAAEPLPTTGTIAIAPRSAGGDYDPALPAFTDAVAATFAAKGFTILDDPNHAAFVADLVVGREDVGTGLARVPGQRQASAMGVGVYVPLSTGKSDVVPLQRTKLELHLHRRGTSAAFWNGAAVTVRAVGRGKGAEATVATDLARAAINAYPVNAPGVVGVP